MRLPFMLAAVGVVVVLVGRGGGGGGGQGVCAGESAMSNWRLQDTARHKAGQTQAGAEGRSGGRCAGQRQREARGVMRPAGCYMGWFCVHI